MEAIYLRADWSLGDVQRRYIVDSDNGDQSTGSRAYQQRFKRFIFVVVDVDVVVVDDVDVVVVIVFVILVLLLLKLSPRPPENEKGEIFLLLYYN